MPALNRVVFWFVYIICSPGNTTFPFSSRKISENNSGNSSRDLNRFSPQPLTRFYCYWTEEFSSRIYIFWRNSSVCIFTNIGTKKKAPMELRRGAQTRSRWRGGNLPVLSRPDRGASNGVGHSALITGMRPRTSWVSLEFPILQI